MADCYLYRRIHCFYFKIRRGSFTAFYNILKKFVWRTHVIKPQIFLNKKNGENLIYQILKYILKVQN